MRRWGGCCWLGICALGLGLGILIAAVFPVGCLMFLVSFLLIVDNPRQDVPLRHRVLEGQEVKA